MEVRAVSNSLLRPAFLSKGSISSFSSLCSSQIPGILNVKDARRGNGLGFCISASPQ